jgi:hypothetical protein
MVWQAVVDFFVRVGAWIAANPVTAALTAYSTYSGVKGYRQAKDMQAKAAQILANKTSAGGKIPVVYGTRRVGAQVVYMDVSNNDSRHLFMVYALSVGECDEILYRTIELDGTPLTDPNKFRYGSYVGSDRNNQTGYNGHQPLNTVSQVGSTISAGAGQFGTNQNARYRITLNLHHGNPSQSADPMLVASMPNWTSSHRLDGVCYIAAHFKFDVDGMWSGVPRLTVQVKGKRVYDPRDASQQFGTPFTYKHSDNPALVFLDYITNNEYGKGLTASQINMSTYSSAANVCDTQVDQPYFNGSAQSLTWSANSGDDFFTITGTGANAAWWQNKIGELLDLYDANGNGVLDEVEIKEIQRTEYFDTTKEFIVFINGYFSSNYSSQNGSSLLKVKRFTTNGWVDTNNNVMDNAQELLSNMRGIFLYIDGKYELSIEDTGTSSFSINDNHIIADAGISVDYGNKDKKANKVVVEFFNANKKYELDTVTVLHDASPEYYSDDNDEVLEIKVEFPYCNDPYIAYNMGKAILTRSRNQTTMQFLGTPEMYKLNVGDIVDLTYAPLGFSGKICRVEALELQARGLVAVSLIEYFDVYTWEVPPQEPVEELANLPSAYAVKAPTGLSFTDTDSSSTGRPFLSWDEPTDFPDYQYRVNVVDSSSNQVLNRIVDVENCDLNFVPTASNYVASVSSLNVLGSESDAATLTFTIGDAPTGSADIKDDAVITDKIINDAITTPKILNDAVTDAKINSLSANKITAGTIDASQITVTNLDADNITSGTLATARLNVNDIISTGSIIVSGDNVSDLTNDASYVDASGAASAAPVQSVAGATGAVSASTIITAGNIVVQGDNISTLTNNENFIDGTQVNSNVTSISGGAITTGTVAAARIDVSGVITAGSIIVSGDNISSLTNDESFIDGTQVNSNVTSISGNVITTGTINASVVNVTNINADNVSTGTLNANRIQIDDVTIDTDGSGNLIIKSGGVDTTQIANNAITNDKILANTITADRINVTDLALDFTADTVTGTAIGGFPNNTMRLKKVADLGTEAGIYHIFCRVFGGTGQVKTLSVVAGDGTYGTTGELDSDFTYSDALFATNLPIANTGYAQFNSGQSQTWSGVDRFDSTYKMVQKDFIVRKTSSTSRTLALYILAQGDGGTRYLSNVQYGFYKFSEI